jgi:hypothetical protein
MAAEQRRLAGQTQHLEARYAAGDEVYVQNPRKTKLAPDYLGPFTVREVHENHNYTIEDAAGNQKRLHHNRLRPCRARAAQRRMTAVFPEYQQLPIDLDAEPGELTDPEAASELGSASDGDVATVQVASVDTSRDGTTEPSVETSRAPSPHIQFTRIRYRHADGTWGSEPEELTGSSDAESEGLFLNNDLSSDSDY